MIIEKTTVRALLPRRITKDMRTDYTDELYIAFVGPETLTEEGEKHFDHILDNEVEIHQGYDAVVYCEDDKENDLLIELFHMLAGYSSVEKHDKYVKRERITR